MFLKQRLHWHIHSYLGFLLIWLVVWVQRWAAAVNVHMYVRVSVCEWVHERCTLVVRESVEWAQLKNYVTTSYQCNTMGGIRRGKHESLSCLLHCISSKTTIKGLNKKILSKAKDWNHPSSDLMMKNSFNFFVFCRAQQDQTFGQTFQQEDHHGDEATIDQDHHLSGNSQEEPNRGTTHTQWSDTHICNISDAKQMMSLSGTESAALTLLQHWYLERREQKRNRLLSFLDPDSPPLSL